MRSSKSGGADSVERGGDVVGERPLDLADEAQRQVELLVVLPAEIGAVVHRVDQQVADVLGRADGDEQPVHRFPSSGRGRGGASRGHFHPLVERPIARVDSAR